jgi:hypothetical protein
MHTPYSRPLPFSLPSGDLGSETGFPVWFEKGRKKREFALFSRWVLSLFLALLRSFLLRGREHERAKKRAFTFEPGKKILTALNSVVEGRQSHDTVALTWETGVDVVVNFSFTM